MANDLATPTCDLVDVDAACVATAPIPPGAKLGAADDASSNVAPLTAKSEAPAALHRPELPGIQYVRGIAALLVLVDHAEYMIGMDKYFGSRLTNGFLLNGFVGVDLFFVLSGFIIVYVTAPRDPRAAQLSVGAFLSRRFVRIIPFLWFCVISHALMKLAAGKAFDGAGYLVSLTLWPLGDPQPAQVWTLRHEMLFYLVFGASLNSRWGKGLLGLFFFAPLAWWGLSSETDASTYRLLDFLFSRDNGLFGLGYVLGLAYVRDWIRIPKQNIGFGWFLVIAALLLAYVEAANYDRHSLAGMLQTGLVCVGILALSLAAPSVGKSPLRKLGKLLGDASYAIYLTHDLFISIVLGLLIKRFPTANLWMVFLLAVATAIAGGVVVHLGIETPLIEWAKRRLKSRSVAATPARG